MTFRKLARAPAITLTNCEGGLSEPRARLVKHRRASKTVEARSGPRGHYYLDARASITVPMFVLHCLFE